MWQSASHLYQTRQKGGAQGARATPVFWEKRMWKSLEVFNRHDLYTNVHPQILATHDGPAFFY